MAQHCKNICALCGLSQGYDLQVVVLEELAAHKGYSEYDKAIFYNGFNEVICIFK